tara:strand:+ start:12443 stop:12829 length:387 start_codon:yes stop_codon:yes gene_type:complete
MAIKYKVVSKRPGGMAGENEAKYYPVLTGREITDLNEVCSIIAKRSTFSGADVVGVVQSFIELVPELLMNGNSVRLDGFGIFSIHASGNGKERHEDVSAQDITKLKLSFLPDKKIKKRLENTKFMKEQ